jgi:hypothetical protein
VKELLKREVELKDARKVGPLAPTCAAVGCCVPQCVVYHCVLLCVCTPVCCCVVYCYVLPCVLLVLLKAEPRTQGVAACTADHHRALLCTALYCRCVLQCTAHSRAGLLFLPGRCTA